MQILKSEDGAITAEYAIATLAGVAFAGPHAAGAEV